MNWFNAAFHYHHRELTLNSAPFVHYRRKIALGEKSIVIDSKVDAC